MTLLEVLIATVIMAIAVAGLFSNLTTSVRNAAKLTAYDRATLLARSKMDELLTQDRLPKNMVLQGPFDPALTGQLNAGWRARVTPYESPGQPAVGMQTLNRLELEIWWMEGEQRKNYLLEAFRRDVIRQEDLAPGGAPK